MVKVLFGRMAAHEPWYAEFWSGVAAIGWVLVLWLFTPGLGGLPAFEMLALMAPEWAWTAVSLALAAAQIWALRADHRLLRVAVAFLMGWWWSFIFLAIVQAVPITPAVALYATLAASNWHSVLRVSLR